MLTLYFIAGILVLDTIYYLSKRRQEASQIIEEVTHDTMEIVHNVEQVIEKTIDEVGFDDFLEEVETTPVADEYELEFDEIYDETK